MLRSTKSPDLERQLLRRSVMALSAGRDRCDGCHRTPLLGERVHVYEGGRTLCELCRQERREQPVRSRSSSAVSTAPRSASPISARSAAAARPDAVT